MLRATPLLHTQNHPGRNMAAESDTPPVLDLVDAALARFRHDLEMYQPTGPAIVYAMARETHLATLQRWRQYPPASQSVLLKALLKAAAGLLREFRARHARIAPTHGHMYGQQEEALKLETLADITVEEVRRIEAELSMLQTGEALH